MTAELEVRSRPPVPLMPGMEWWVDNPHRLAARVRTDRSVVELERYELAPGLHGSLVRRLRPRPPAWVRPVVISSGVALVGLSALMLLVGLVQSLVAALVLLWPLLAGVAGAWVLLRALLGHRATCAGLHCPGCRG